MPATVFVSHSTKTDEAKAYLDAMEIALGEDPVMFKPWIDKKGLLSGDDWCAKIFESMDDAHGAVLLLSKEALESQFAQIELTILNFRRCREQAFPIIPVLIGQVTEANLEHGLLGQLHLERLQCEHADDPTQTAKRVVERLRQELADYGRKRTPTEIAISNIASHLRNAGVTPQDVLETVDKISARNNTQLPGWTTDVHYSRLDCRDNLARVLVKLDIEMVCYILTELAARCTDPDGNLWLALDWLAPFWVRQDHAAAIPRVAMSPNAQRLLGLDACCINIAQAYLARAFIQRLASSPRFLHLELEPPDTEDPAPWVKDQIIKLLAPKFMHTGRLDKFKLALERLRNYENACKPVVISFVSQSVLNSAFVDEVRRDFKTPTLLFLAEADLLATASPPVEVIFCPDIAEQMRILASLTNTFGGLVKPVNAI